MLGTYPLQPRDPGERARTKNRMGVPLRVLIVEDSEDAVALSVHELQRAGYAVSWQRVESPPAMSAALARQSWDIVLADDALPGFGGLDALKVLQESGHDVPFILLSGRVGEEAAVAATRAGARDFLLKDHLDRLVGAVERELREAQVRHERRQAEDALREHEAITRAIVNTAVDGIITVDERGRIQSFNPAAERLFGYAAADVLEQSIKILMPPPYRERHDDYIAAYLRTGVKRIIGVGREVVGQRRDGTMFPIDLAVSEVVLGERRLFTGVVRDITARKRAEMRLALQFATTRVLAASPSFAEAGPRLLQAICEATGWELGELWQVDAPSDVLRWAAVWHVPALAPASFIALSQRTTFARGNGLPGLVWASGQPAWIEDVVAAASFARFAAAAELGLHGTFAFPVRTDRAVLGVMVFFGREKRRPEAEWLQTLDALGRQIGDFIERKRAEEALHETERRFTQFMLHLPGVAFMKDVQGRYVYVNDAFEELFHRKLSDYTGKTDEEVWPPAIAAQLRANDRRVVDTRAVLQTTEIIPHDDGGHHWLVTKFPILGADGRLSMVGGVAIDITERRRAEAELRDLQKVAQQRERLADIGAITAQIVHDLGNPLAGVSMQAQLILRRAGRDANQPISTIVKPVERILTEVRRLDSLTKEFMEFSREQRLDLKAVNVRGFLQRVVDLWQPVAATREITIVLEAPSDVPSLTADEEKLHRVFDNLVKNAIEAIDEGPGRVAIQVTLPQADAVRISVTDTGPGIPEQVQVFRLFETTKPQGSGIGLAVARQIVLAHRGSIQCARLDPRGTIFSIDLPSSNPAA